MNFGAGLTPPFKETAYYDVYIGICCPIEGFSAICTIVIGIAVPKFKSFVVCG